MTRPAGSQVDPSHLVALHVLLEEQHVTRAAARLGITQSSMSHRLARLREVLKDPLFVRAGTRLVPTPRALAIATPLSQALAALEAAVAPPAAFNPAISRAQFTLALPDLLAPAVAPVLASVAAKASNMRIRCVGIPPRLAEWLREDSACMALVPRHFLDASSVSRQLGELHFGVAARQDHPALRHKLSLEQWLNYGHVIVRTGNDGGNLIDEALAGVGRERKIGLEVPSFLMGLLAVATSDLLMNVPLPLAQRATRQLGLRLRPTPIPLPKVRFVLAWHPRFQEDAAHTWVRTRIVAALQTDFTQTP